MYIYMYIWSRQAWKVDNCNLKILFYTSTIKHESYKQISNFAFRSLFVVVASCFGRTTKIAEQRNYDIE